MEERLKPGLRILWAFLQSGSRVSEVKSPFPPKGLSFSGLEPKFLRSEFSRQPYLRIDIGICCIQRMCEKNLEHLKLLELKKEKRKNERETGEVICYS